MKKWRVMIVVIVFLSVQLLNSKQSLDEWMYETSKEKVSYDTNKYERSI